MTPHSDGGLLAGMLPGSLATERALAGWKHTEWLFELIAPALLSRLPPPATPEAIVRAEEQLGFQLPESMVAVYLIHDGIGMPSIVDDCLVTSFLLCLDDVVTYWRELAEVFDAGDFDGARIERVEGPVRPDWWNRKWLPITSDPYGNHMCIDLDPAPGGNAGQVVEYWHDSAERIVSAVDLAGYLIEGVDVIGWAEAEGVRIR